MTDDQASATHPDGLPLGHELVRTCDHYANPVSAGMHHATVDELVVVCLGCNRSKGNRTIVEWLGDQCAPTWAIKGWCVNPAARRQSRDWFSPEPE